MHVGRGTDIYQTVLVNVSAPDGGNKAYHAPVSLPSLTLPTIPLGNARPAASRERKSVGEKEQMGGRRYRHGHEGTRYPLKETTESWFSSLPITVNVSRQNE
jgi:hypothetical protein